MSLGHYILVVAICITPIYFVMDYRMNHHPHHLSELIRK